MIKKNKLSYNYNEQIKKNKPISCHILEYTNAIGEITDENLEEKIKIQILQMKQFIKYYKKYKKIK